MRNILVAISLLFILGSCSITKQIPEGKTLYEGYEVKILNDSLGNSSSLIEEISVDILPRTNKRILGFPYKVWFYYNIGEPKKKRGIRNFLQRKLGENPVFFTESILTFNEKSLLNKLENRGYFRSSVFSLSETEKKRETAIFEITLSPQYFLNAYTLNAVDSAKFDLVDKEQLMEKTVITPKTAYNLSKIIQERERISSYLREKGYYFISSNQFEMIVDTNLGNSTFNLDVKLTKNINQLAIQPYKIRNINIMTNASGRQAKDTLSVTLKQISSSGFSDFGGSQFYKSKVFEESILFRSGDYYSITKQDQSLNRLTNLKNFQFIKNKFDLVSQGDSNVLDVNYILTPSKKKSVKAQLSGLTKSNGLYGSEASLAWQHKNLFGGAEILNLELNGGVDLQFGQNEFGNNYRRFGLQANLTFPRFLVPFDLFKTRLGNGVPKTNISASYELLRRKDFYTQTSSNVSFAYLWRKNVEFEHNFTPVYFSLIKASNFSDNFTNQIFLSDNLRDIERYFQILESRLILGMEYKLNFTPQSLQTNGNRANFAFGLDVAGNFASLIARDRTGEGLIYKTLFNVPFEQFAKFEVESKYFKTFGPLTWANRLFTGFGIPYSNSNMIPQTRQYFVGGNNGLRGFRARTLGPGTTAPIIASQDIFGFNQGDIKFEANSELRYKASQYIELATFYDAGNVWNYRGDTYNGEEAKFTKDFMNQLAMDVGIGLRFDFTYLIIRGDLATPIRKPWLVDNPWVLKDIALGQKAWRQENLIFNLAIAHPF